MASIEKKPINIQTTQNKFNKGFEAAERDAYILAEEEANRVIFKKDEPNDYYKNFEPREFTEDLGINTKNLFFDILELLSNGINPIPYVMENPKRQYVFAVLVLGIGVLLMFFSNLML
jgi:hypothetical protein